MKVFFFVDVKRADDEDEERGLMCGAIDALSEHLETMHEELHEKKGLADRGRSDFVNDDFAGSVVWFIDPTD